MDGFGTFFPLKTFHVELLFAFSRKGKGRLPSPCGLTLTKSTSIDTLLFPHSFEANRDVISGRTAAAVLSDRRQLLLQRYFPQSCSRGEVLSSLRSRFSSGTPARVAYSFCEADGGRQGTDNRKLLKKG